MKSSVTMIEFNIDEVLKDCTKKELYKVVEKLNGSNNFEIDIEPGSKIGKTLPIMNFMEMVMHNG